MVGSKIFDWYNETHKQNIQKVGGIQDWDPLTMTGYSDGFSYLENAETMKKSFSFISDNDTIITPDEQQYNSGSGNNKNDDLKKNKFDNEFENFMNQRSYDVPAPAQRL